MVVGGGAAVGWLIDGQDVGAAAGVVAGGIGGEPGAIRNGHGAGNDAIGDRGRQDEGSPVVVNPHVVAVVYAAGGGVGGVHQAALRLEPVHLRLVGVG